MSQQPWIEWAPFKTAPEVTEDQLLRASEELQRGFLAHQRGFVRRDLLRGRDGGWVDLVVWSDEAAAHEAMEAATKSPACATYFGCMADVAQADPSASVQHLRCVASYG